MAKRATQPTIDRRILQPGRGGLLTLAEAEYIRDALASDGRLRRRWGLEDRTRFPLTVIAARAFPENPRAARDHIRMQQHHISTYSLRGKRPEQAVHGILFEAA